MLVFIDDSGDPGFKVGQGSSQYFIIAMIIFDDSLEAEKTAIAIKELRRELGFPDSVEFKFSQSSNKVRKEFLQRVTPFSFRIRSLVVNKNLIYSSELKSNKKSFYGYAIKTTLQHSRGSIRNAKIKIDGSGDRTFKKTFLAYLRKQLNENSEKIFDDCKLVKSDGNVLIQLADMIAGAIRRSYEGKDTNADIYKSIIKKHIENEWQFR